MQMRNSIAGPQSPAFTVAVVWSLSLACADADSRSDAVAVRDSAGIAIVDSDLPRLSATCAVAGEPDVLIGSGDGGEDYELYRVFGASRLSDGRIVLVNQGSQQLRFYDAEGRFLMNAGRAGRGPGEFQDAFYLWVLPGDTIWVGDYRPWQFLVFGPDGQWIRSVRPTPEYGNSPAVINVLNDGRSVLAERPFGSYGPTFELRHITVVIHDPAGALIDTVGTYPNGRWGRVGDDPRSPGLYPLFESFTRIDAAGSKLVIGHSAEAQLSILEANPDLRLDRVVRWTTESRAISKEDIEAERRRIAEPYEDLDPAMRRLMVEPLVSEDRPVADRFPAFSSVMLGRDGRIWIREFTKPNGPAGQQWVAFGSGGRFQCRAALPDLDQVLEFGRNYLLALDRNDLGVERVVQYPIAAPADSR